jgi:hypothetical protein
LIFIADLFLIEFEKKNKQQTIIDHLVGDDDVLIIIIEVKHQLIEVLSI